MVVTREETIAEARRIVKYIEFSNKTDVKKLYDEVYEKFTNFCKTYLAVVKFMFMVKKIGKEFVHLYDERAFVDWLNFMDAEQAKWFNNKNEMAWLEAQAKYTNYLYKYMFPVYPKDKVKKLRVQIVNELVKQHFGFKKKVEKLGAEFDEKDAQYKEQYKKDFYVTITSLSNLKGELKDSWDLEYDVEPSSPINIDCSDATSFTNIMDCLK